MHIRQPRDDPVFEKDPVIGPAMIRGHMNGCGKWSAWSADHQTSCMSANHVDRFLRDGVESGYRLGTCFERALRNNQV